MVAVVEVVGATTAADAVDAAGLEEDDEGAGFLVELLEVVAELVGDETDDVGAAAEWDDALDEVSEFTAAAEATPDAPPALDDEGFALEDVGEDDELVGVELLSVDELPEEDEAEFDEPANKSKSLPLFDDDEVGEVLCPAMVNTLSVGVDEEDDVLLEEPVEVGWAELSEAVPAELVLAGDAPRDPLLGLLLASADPVGWLSALDEEEEEDELPDWSWNTACSDGPPTLADVVWSSALAWPDVGILSEGTPPWADDVEDDEDDVDDGWVAALDWPAVREDEPPPDDSFGVDVNSVVLLPLFPTGDVLGELPLLPLDAAWDEVEGVASDDPCEPDGDVSAEGLGFPPPLLLTAPAFVVVVCCEEDDDWDEDAEGLELLAAPPSWKMPKPVGAAVMVVLTKKAMHTMYNKRL